MNDLLPCPFCGGEAYRDHSADCTGTPMVGCMDCSAHVVARTQVGAENEWNRRALPAASQQPAASVSGVTVQEAGWLPIETAPRDGTPIIATTNEYDEPLILRWFMVNGHEAWRDWDADSYINVTHWMPLPEPPALSALEGK